MLWHEDVAEDIEFMPATESFEASLEGGSECVVIQKRFAAITTEGQEMQMTGVLISLEVVRHGRILGPIPPHGQVPAIGGAPTFGMDQGFGARMPLKLSRYWRKTSIQSRQATRPGAMPGSIVRWKARML